MAPTYFHRALSDVYPSGHCDNGKVVATLRAGNGRLVFYGPFAERGVDLTEGNAKFHATLQSRGLGWGLREVEWVTELATAAGLALVTTVPMPANNLSIVYSKPAAE